MSRSFRPGAGIPGVLFLVAGSAALGQWSDDPAANLVLADHSGEQVQAKVVPTGDGGAYVSWYDNETGGYDVFLQRLDVGGVEQWPHNGVLVADRGFSSTQDYGLGIDGTGHALLAFRDDSGTGVQIAAARIAPDGTQVWGAGGVQLTATSDFLAAPEIVGTTDGQIVVAWTQETTVVATKLDAAGSTVWGPVVLSPAAGSFALADLQPGDAGTAIVSFVHSATGAGPRHLWAQKLASADGASLWAAGHVKVYDAPSGSLQFGSFPTFLPDGGGGGVFAWYTSSPTLQVRAQRLLSDGTEVFPHDGVEASTDAGQLRVSPAVAWRASASEVFLFWTELDGTQSSFGLSGQKLDAGGIRQWGAGGTVLVPLGALEISQVRTLGWADGALVAWVETVAFGNQPIRSTRVDGAGDPVWSPATTELSTAPTGTSRLASAGSSAGFGIFAWQDGSSDDDVLAQAVSPDGSLGAGGLFADGFESGDTTGWSAVAP